MINRTSSLIFFDKLFTPFYLICDRLFSFTRDQNTTITKIFVIKLFGMGSIVRMTNVLKNAEGLSADIELITLSKNRIICEEIGIKAHFIENRNILRSLIDLVKIIRLIRTTEGVKVIDLERKSNLSGIFRLISANGRVCASFSFENENKQQDNQTFITLKDKPILKALEEIFECEIKESVKFSEVHGKSNQIIVNINAGEYLPQRKYPIKHFFNVIQQLHERQKSFEFVLTGLSNEREYTQALIQRLEASKIPFKDTTGKLSLSGLITLLKEARLLITNDSGPLHLAYYFNVPTVAIWGPTSAKLVAYPDSQRMKNVSLNHICSPCFIHPKSRVATYCHGGIDCLQNLAPEKVVQFTMELSESLDIFAEDVR